MLLLRLSGVFLLRLAERTFLPLLFAQHPVRACNGHPFQSIYALGCNCKLRLRLCHYPPSPTLPPQGVKGARGRRKSGSVAWLGENIDAGMMEMQNNKIHRDLARNLRKNLTTAEQQLWACLRKRQLDGFRVVGQTCILA
jgi:hypothetical protein